MIMTTTMVTPTNADKEGLNNLDLKGFSGIISYNFILVTDLYQKIGSCVHF